MNHKTDKLPLDAATVATKVANQEAVTGDHRLRVLPNDRLGRIATLGQSTR